eukprot:CAMPEP_0175901448 /NCGR_PEP_ID=MMETSP0108-20121206/2872_1 /TAXON_ID=195067 ORGANISM="Goniomonas pacifica, Strain CCMP1869" /NCGR_SAMPLE_ID=MMETSP0108 /ASSEMBLY_ACC=CAM_ASM_000204 /LENGTH=98 /DNA_ID=CAMNT_0017223041 /DNA_START=156 /DNA_END=452 /DNA_ORIENTATION=-
MDVAEDVEFRANTLLDLLEKLDTAGAVARRFALVAVTNRGAVSHKDVSVSWYELPILHQLPSFDIKGPITEPGLPRRAPDANSIDDRSGILQVGAVAE